MNRPALLIGATALILAHGVLNAESQEYPEYQRRMPPQQIQQPQELEQPGARSQGRAENDNRQKDDGRMMMGRGWRFHEDWLPEGRGAGAMGADRMRSPRESSVMMRMIFALMDADGDGSLSLEEFQAAHARMFKGMDANKDGSLTMEEMRAFMQGARRPSSGQ